MQNPTHTLSWQGFSLTMPVDWNLAHYQGNAQKGLITVANLSGPILTLRWQTICKPRDPAEKLTKSLDKLVATLKEKGAEVSRSPKEPRSASIKHKSFTGWLWCAGSRLYEQEIHGGGDRLPAPVRCDDYSTQRDWPWELYGIKGTVPRRYSLVKVSLHPGRPQLTFRRFWNVIQLGSWPMADALLNGQQLTTWAKGAIPLLRNSSAVAHQIEPANVRFTVRGMLRRSQRFRLTHDADSNTIRWSQRPEGLPDE